ncbi:MAG: hypothetical protein ACK559_14655, partial [bacterium]
GEARVDETRQHRHHAGAEQSEAAGVEVGRPGDGHPGAEHHAAEAQQHRVQPHDGLAPQQAVQRPEAQRAEDRELARRHRQARDGGARAPGPVHQDRREHQPDQQLRPPQRRPQ